MSSELAVIQGTVAVIAFFYWVGFRLMDTDHEAYSLFAFLLGAVTTWGLSGAIREILAQSSSGISSSLATTYDAIHLAVILFGIITLLYFILRIMIMPLINANKKKRFKIS